MVDGPSFVAFGEILQTLRELGPGRYPFKNAAGEDFHVVLYSDYSWRVATPQLPLFPEQEKPHTLT